MNAIETAEYHRLWLLRVLGTLFELAGFSPGETPVSRMPKLLRRMILRGLKPAEAAGRRLIFYIATRLQGPLPPVRSASRGTRSADNRKRTRKRAPVFWLFDRRRFLPELSKGRRGRRGTGPQIRSFDDPTPPPEPEKPQRDPDDAGRLCRRLEALYAALSDLPAQAQRMLRAMEKRRQAPPGPGRYGPIRGGLPPAFRQNRTHEVDEILYETHLMAVSAHPPP